jgi:hypothetical protein
MERIDDPQEFLASFSDHFHLTLELSKPKMSSPESHRTEVIHLPVHASINGCMVRENGLTVFFELILDRKF